MFALVFLLFSSILYGEDRFYTQLSLAVWTRNFEEATPQKNNQGVESTEGGFVAGFGYRLNSDWAFEIEFLPTMDFTVRDGAREGKIHMWAVTLAPKYTFSWRAFDNKLSFFAKIRLGYTQIMGTTFYGNNGGNSSYTMGPAIGADYILNSDWEAFLDIGGLWAGGDVEDYDFHPWLIGLRYQF